MNREIKFRAWDKSEGEMIYWGYLLNDPDDWLLGILRGETEDTLMQFTGLRDKNGVEIYEGDILKYTYPAGYAHCEVRFGEWDNSESYEDNKSGNGWYIKEWAHYKLTGHKSERIDVRISGFTTYPMNAYKEEMKVIGNIYENPELLENEQNKVRTKQ